MLYQARGGAHAGSRRMALEFARHGFCSHSFEIADDPREEVLQPSVKTWLQGLAGSQRLMLVWLGPVCASWSRARRNMSGKPGLPPATHAVSAFSLDSRILSLAATAKSTRLFGVQLPVPTLSTFAVRW